MNLEKSLAAFIQSSVLKRQEPLFPVIVRPQYFFKPSLWKNSGNDVMLDCGAYDGDSIFNFIEFNSGNYKGIVACEPDPSNLLKLRENLRVRDVKKVLILNVGVGDKEAKLKQKREKVKAAKRAIPRDIEFVCLKNRYGESNYTCKFKYYAQFDYFIPLDSNGSPRSISDKNIRL